MAEYVCDECGAQIALSDTWCLGCGHPHPHAIEERPHEDPEADLTHGSIGLWALGGVFFLALFVIAIFIATQAG
jgi:DNA-directed RNA polymerase subunit RPC12/RpoP